MKQLFSNPMPNVSGYFGADLVIYVTLFLFLFFYVVNVVINRWFNFEFNSAK